MKPVRTGFGPGHPRCRSSPHSHRPPPPGSPRNASLFDQYCLRGIDARAPLYGIVQPARRTDGWLVGRSCPLDLLETTIFLPSSYSSEKFRYTLGFIVEYIRDSVYKRASPSVHRLQMETLISHNESLSMRCSPLVCRFSIIRIEISRCVFAYMYVYNALEINLYNYSYDALKIYHLTLKYSLFRKPMFGH